MNDRSFISAYRNAWNSVRLAEQAFEDSDNDMERQEFLAIIIRGSQECQRLLSLRQTSNHHGLADVGSDLAQPSQSRRRRSR